MSIVYEHRVGNKLYNLFSRELNDDVYWCRNETFSVRVRARVTLRTHHHHLGKVHYGRDDRSDERDTTRPAESRV